MCKSSLSHVFCFPIFSFYNFISLWPQKVSILSLVFSCGIEGNRDAVDRKQHSASNV